VAPRTGGGDAADAWAAAGGHREAPEPEREDGEHAQVAPVREVGDRRHDRVGPAGEPAWAGGPGPRPVEPTHGRLLMLSPKKKRADHGSALRVGVGNSGSGAALLILG